MVGQVVSVQVLVQPFHDVGKRADVSDLGLRPCPVRKRLDLAHVLRIGDATLGSRGQREFHRVQPGQVLADEIRVASELVPLVELLGPVVTELVARDACDEQGAEREAGPEHQLAPFNDGGTESLEEGVMGSKLHIWPRNGK